MLTKVDKIEDKKTVRGEKKKEKRVSLLWRTKKRVAQTRVTS